MTEVQEDREDIAGFPDVFQSKQELARTRTGQLGQLGGTIKGYILELARRGALVNDKARRCGTAVAERARRYTAYAGRVARSRWYRGE